MILKQRQQVYLQQKTYQYACKLHIKEEKVEVVTI